MVERKAFLISLTLSLVSMLLVYQYISNEDDKLKNDYGVFFPIVVATRDILQYETIRPTDLEVIRIPKSMAPYNRLENIKDVVDAVAAIPISRGEHILDNKIISKNVYSGLDTQVAMGRRAISISVTMKSSLGFMVRPGNRVDLAAHFEYRSDKSNISEVKVFMQDLLVLAAGRTIQIDTPKGVDQGFIKNLYSEVSKSGVRDIAEVKDTLDYAKQDSNFQTITLEVTPEQAQQIVYVMAVYGDSISCMLRHSDDRQVSRMPTTNLYDVMGTDSYLVQGNRVAPQKALPRPKFVDYVGDRAVPVY